MSHDIGDRIAYNCAINAHLFANGWPHRGPVLTAFQLQQAGEAFRSGIPAIDFADMLLRAAAPVAEQNVTREVA